MLFILSFEEFINNANGLVGLITGLVGLIGAAVGAYFAIKNFVKLTAEKDAKEIWETIKTAADAAMTAAEESGKKGAAKKEMAIEIVKATLKAADLNIDGFIDQLSDYIDQSIKFVNDMKNKKDCK